MGDQKGAKMQREVNQRDVAEGEKFRGGVLELGQTYSS